MAGGSYYIEDDDKTSSFKCQIFLLDGSKEYFTISKKATGQCLIDLVFDSIELVEREYFGLQFKDSNPNSGKFNRWLIGSKYIKKQLIGTQPFQLFLRMRFYPSDIKNMKEEYTKYLLYLQIKKDIYEERLYCSEDIIAILCSYSLQSEVGDYKIAGKKPGYLSQKFIRNQTQKFENEVEKLHAARELMTSEDAENEFISIASKLPYYGVDIFNALTLDKELVQIGPSATGFNVFQNRKRIYLFLWTSIYKISFKKKRLYVQVKSIYVNGSIKPEIDTSIKSPTNLPASSPTTIASETPYQRFIFILSSFPVCKTLWQNCVDYHIFFRLNKSEQQQQNNNNNTIDGFSSRNNSYKVIVSHGANHRCSTSSSNEFNNRGSVTPGLLGTRSHRIVTPFLDDMQNWSRNTKQSLKKFISNNHQSESKCTTKSQSTNNTNSIACYFNDCNNDDDNCMCSCNHYPPSPIEPSTPQHQLSIKQCTDPIIQSCNHNRGQSKSHSSLIHHHNNKEVDNMRLFVDNKLNQQRIIAKFDSESSEEEYDNHVVSNHHRNLKPMNEVSIDKSDEIPRTTMYCTTITNCTPKLTNRKLRNEIARTNFYLSNNTSNKPLDRFKIMNKSFDESYDSAIVPNELKANPSLESLPEMTTSIPNTKNYHITDSLNTRCLTIQESNRLKSNSCTTHIPHQHQQHLTHPHIIQSTSLNPTPSNSDRFRSSSIGPSSIGGGNINSSNSSSNSQDIKSKSNMDIMRTFKNKDDLSDLVSITLYPDRTGRYGFTIKGGVDLGVPLTINNIAPNSPADICYPRLHVGDQIIAIGNWDLSNKTQEDAILLVKQCSSTAQGIGSAGGELKLTIRPSNYLAEYKSEQVTKLNSSPVSSRKEILNSSFGIKTRFNVDITNTDTNNKTISTSQTDAVVQSMKNLESALSNDDLVPQFETVYRLKQGLTMNHAKKTENFIKNRYRDISPYDQTRVILKGNSDYINASIVNMKIGENGPTNRYIAAQGPLAHTVSDFWQMCWEQGSRVVVMVTALSEGGRAKCHRYWPMLYETEEVAQTNIGAKPNSGDDKNNTNGQMVLHVTCLSEERTSGTNCNGANSTNTEISGTGSRQFRGWTERDLVLYCPTNGEERRVKQLQYDGWPDHGVPPFHSEFARFVTRVRQCRGSYLEPVIVHCSAGIGRTGVLITMETAMCLLEAGLPVDPIVLLRQMRDQRASMIQTPAQFIFVCEAILKIYKEIIRL